MFLINQYHSIYTPFLRQDFATGTINYGGTYATTRSTSLTKVSNLSF